MEFLSEEWIAALDRAARSNTATAPDRSNAPNDADAPSEFEVEFRIDAARYHVTGASGALRFRPGAAPRPDVTLTLDRHTAAAIAQGRLPAQTAFMNGLLRLGGDAQALVRHATAFARIGAIMHTVQQETEY